MPTGAYAASRRMMVEGALAGAGVAATVRAPVIVPPKSRRRAVFKIKRRGADVAIGFHAARAHTIVDMRQCEVLTPRLFALAGALRAPLAGVLKDGEACELHVTQTATGFDCIMRWQRKGSAQLVAQLAKALGGLGIARLMLNGQLVFETAVPTVQLGGVPVGLPPGAFLQASAEGEAALVARVLELLPRARKVADLFAGCGTFSLALARKAKVHAVEQNGAALAALALGARAPGLKPVTTEVRDLFALPLGGPELAGPESGGQESGGFDAVVLDPPRAGARQQVAMLAASPVPVIVYVSCDPASFARDAALLVRGGYAMGPVLPVDQFLWSSHIELVAGFTRTR